MKTIVSKGKQYSIDYLLWKRKWQFPIWGEILTSRKDMDIDQLKAYLIESANRSGKRFRGVLIMKLWTIYRKKVRTINLAAFNNEEVAKERNIPFYY